MDLVFHIRRVVFLLSLFFCYSSMEAHSYSSIGLASMSSSRESAQPLKIQQGPLIVLDAGHGGKDEGAKVRQLQEKKIALLTTLYAKRYLEELGYRVLLTRGKDVYVPLSKRVLIANKMKCAAFVSVHFNSAKNHLAQGLEVFYSSRGGTERERSSRRLANFLLHYVMDQTGAPSRGVKLGNQFHVIRETQMASVIFEAGFMTNQEEWIKMREKPYLEKIAKGLAQGVDRYLKS